MGLDPGAALSATFPVVRSHWTPDDVIRYHLAVGAGATGVDARELRYLYEQQLVVLPTFTVVAASDAAVLATGSEVIGNDPSTMVHGEHEVEVHREVPAAAAASSCARIDAIYDKGRNAVVVVAVETATDAGPLATHRFHLVLPGQGGFGGDRGPRRSRERPAARPDVRWSVRMLPQQHAMYRLSGDRTPIHIDPVAAAAAGFERPTLPGLCTWGTVAKGAVDTLLDGDVQSLRSISARFTGFVFPSETLAVEAWRDGDRIVLDATVRDRGTPALSAELTVR